MPSRDPTKLEAIQQKYRGLAIGDGLREAAEALAAQVGTLPRPPRPHKSSTQYPFERALAQHLGKMEARYGSLLDGAPDAIVVTDAAGEIVFLNITAARQFGYEPRELTGRKLGQLLSGAPVDRLLSEGAAATVEVLLDQTAVGIELVAIHKDGGNFPVEATLGLVEGDDGVLLLVAVRNITMRKTAERHLARDALRSSALFDQAPSAMLVVNKRNRIVALNSAATRLFGCDRNEAVGQPATAILPSELAERLQGIGETAGDETGETGSDTWIEYSGSRQDGTQIVFEAATSLVQDEQGRVAVAAFRELDHGAVARRASQILELELHRDVLQAMPDAVVVVDLEGKVVLLNAEAERRFGYARDELVGQPIVRILPDGFVERLGHDALRSAEAALAREIGTGIELVGCHKDGTRFPVELMLAPLERSEGAFMIATLRDLTVRRAAERHLAAIEEDRLHEVSSAGRAVERRPVPEQESEELHRFAYLVAHDLQEPLRMVASYTHLLAERYKGRLDADADDFIGFAVDGARRMQTLIADMLIYCRVDTSGMRLEPLSSADALAQAIASLKAAVVESGATITCDSLPNVMADRTQLTQLFQNLVANAIKYRGNAPPAIAVSATRMADGKWDFALTDNGIGIEPEDLERIFVMFQRLHRHDTIPGSGIGLAAAKRIVERHGGRIWVDSRPGAGSTFHFTLPDSGETR